MLGDGRNHEKGHWEGMRTLRAAAESPPTLLAGVEVVPVPPLTAVVLPDDAILDMLRMCRLKKASGVLRRSIWTRYKYI